jgi:hypothetical protein
VEDLMNRLFIVLVLLVVGIAGLGLYLGWFAVASDSVGGKSHVTLTVDKEKIKADENTALDKVKGLGNQPTTTEKSKD